MAFQTFILSPPPGFKPMLCLKPVQYDDDKIPNIDENADVWPSVIAELFQNLRFQEIRNRPLPNYMENVQRKIHPRTRSLSIEWLVYAARLMSFSEETLHLSVNYLDRYLTGNEVRTGRTLALAAVASLRIAWKHEDDFGLRSMQCFLFLAGNTFSRDEVLLMERSVLDYLEFDLTVPTAVHFLPRFAKAAKSGMLDKDAVVERVAEYIAEISLYFDSMPRFVPSMIAASSVFLAKFIVDPSKRPWNSTLRHYTMYRASELRECVAALHGVWFVSRYDEDMCEVRNKYGGRRYMCASLRYCHSSIPQQFFLDL